MGLNIYIFDYLIFFLNFSLIRVKFKIVEYLNEIDFEKYSVFFLIRF